MEFCFVAVYKVWIHKGFAYERTYMMSRFNTATTVSPFLTASQC